MRPQNRTEDFDVGGRGDTPGTREHAKTRHDSFVNNAGTERLVKMATQRITKPYAMLRTTFASQNWKPPIAADANANGSVGILFSHAKQTIATEIGVLGIPATAIVIVTIYKKKTFLYLLTLHHTYNQTTQPTFLTTIVRPSSLFSLFSLSLSLSL